MSETITTSAADAKKQVRDSELALLAKLRASHESASANAIADGAAIHDHVWLTIELDPAYAELGHSKGAFRKIAKHIETKASDDCLTVNVTRLVQWHTLATLTGLDLSKQSTQVLRRFERLLDYDDQGELYFKWYSPKAEAFALKWLAKEGKARLTAETAAEQLSKFDPKRFPMPKPKAEAEAEAAAPEASDVDTQLEQTLTQSSAPPQSAADVLRIVRDFAAEASADERKLLFAGLRELMDAHVQQSKQAHKPAPAVAVA
jgi:hypothetical protein